MINRLYIDNYKGLVNFELKLQELTLLLGPNGVGKSSVLDVVFELRRFLSGITRVADTDIDNRAFPVSTLTRWQSRNIQVFEMDAVLNSKDYRYRLEIEHDEPNRRARVELEQLEMQGKPLFIFKHGEVQLFRDNHSAGPMFSGDWSESALARVPSRNDNSHLTRFLDFIKKILICGIYPANFTPESSTEDSVLHRDARNFAAWYRHLLQERQDLVPDFTNSLKEVITGFRGMRLEKVGLDTRALMIIFDRQNEKYELRLNELSDGQRALIVLYSLVKLAAGQGYTLFLDEPDNYVALAEIQPWLMELSDASGISVRQCVICSHHPELIDYLGVENGILLEQETSGVTRPKLLSELKWNDSLKLSEVIARGWQK